MSQASNNRIFANGWMFAVYLFLYLPIITLVVFSFNDSKLVTVWSHASTRWYSALMEDSDLISAVLLSLKIAFLSALMSVFFGTFTALRSIVTAGFAVVPLCLQWQPRP